MTDSTHDAAQLRAIADSVDWWHSIDLGKGVVTKGGKSPEILQGELEALRGLDLAGKTVLDIGAYDGFFSFEAERRGAKRVVALDHYVWSLDLPEYNRYSRECASRGVTPLPNEQTPHWQPKTLPGKRGFDAAHKALNSKVETVVGDYMSMDLAPLGRFNVVFFMGVLYHMRDPIGSLERLAAVTKEVAIIETHCVAIAGYEDREMCELYSASQLNGDISNWWGPNMMALEGMCRAVGFSRVERVTGGPPVAPREALTMGNVLRKVGLRPPRKTRPGDVQHFRVAVQAWK